MIAQCNVACSAVLEQTDSGQVIEVRGAAAAPDANPHLAQFDFSAGVEATLPQRTRHRSPTADERLNIRQNDVPLATAFIDTTNSVLEFTDAPADDAVEAGSRRPLASFPSPAGATKHAPDFLSVRLGSPSLPKARNMSNSFTSDQRDMYWLAVNVGRRFASRLGVRNSTPEEAMLVDLFTTMIQRESNFNPRAVSAAGAEGLGQLMPSTARQLGVKDPFSARHNLEGAATYLAEMLNEFRSIELALAAYNAGPAAVRKYGSIPPYRETRQYVSDILHAVGVGPHSNTRQTASSGKDTPSHLLFHR
ncbi:lytic transglycosylase domain-containing protein [Microvirga tunisiensis]|uniref:Lytic transglycosylase domain-containing protein n=2 Tax=Microvirga tunisiensis TaxID=2108360 RepID=A0A5N7MMT3_9HYPH|nr:lytic transglycosylase domain-containing protein [Microvirga tunisiensis]MPR28362.1 lytic transglycosylase domain-containing protein [Microvirga tunisiensis]